MSTVSVRLSDKELSLFKDYAKVNNKSISEIIRESVLSRIEDEYDLHVFEECSFFDNFMFYTEIVI